MPTLSLMDADEFAHNDQPAVVVVSISREQIEKGATGSVMERLLILNDSRQNCMLYRESVLFEVQGYDADPRWLAEIPEVRAFFATITREWPFFIWFLARNTGAVSLYFSLVCDVNVIRIPGVSEVGLQFRDPQQICTVLEDLVSRADVTFAALGVPDEALREAIDSAVAEVLGY